MQNSQKRQNKNRGFTLLEMLVVVLIIGLIVSVVVYNVAREPDKARAKTTRIQIESFDTALQAYKLDNGHYPSTEQGLEALVEKPSGFPEPKHWGPDPYINKTKIPQDKWGNDYIYSNDGRNYLIISYGADGEQGGEDVAADIRSDE
ncbi:MAG: type II secretion system major pseudopilin GspG [Gammaproteobacteria bacterium]|nr:type II secretion system major pseudopilin GspG [Gammaproteobacteria bacterium]